MVSLFLHYCCGPKLKRYWAPTKTQMCKIWKHSNVQICKCANVHMHKCVNAQFFLFCLTSVNFEEICDTCTHSISRMPQKPLTKLDVYLRFFCICIFMFFTKIPMDNINVPIHRIYCFSLLYVQKKSHTHLISNNQLKTSSAFFTNTIFIFCCLHIHIFLKIV